ncbi:Ubiquitin carboxyl-terminal hydrolase [Meloidogyne graminicola]|uniref:Multifunctional fusion protein n=1 Tax=Meloidogyne graminicola TaxID=189291 RepID=A0A8S9ZDE9_9BILA|nr:Ubiquitin carboxyl-terminal hydrolase [Meloidogyne graminicola]
MRITRHCFSSLFGNAICNKLEKYSQYRPSSLTIQQYLDFGLHGTAKTSFSFLKTELLVRLANIMKEIELLPPSLLNTSSARQVADWYRKSFQELLCFEDTLGDEQDIFKFNDQLQTILKRHSNVVQTMAEGLIELKSSGGIDMGSEQSIQYFLDRFYLNRISIRMLQYQHLVVFGTVLPESPNHVGCIDPVCDVSSVVRDAYENARFLCDRYYLNSPQLELDCLNALSPGKKLSVVIVPSHLYHIMFELFKNAMRATVEHVGMDEDLPPVKVRIVRGNEDLSIKLSDRGGGVPRSIISRLFDYMYSTAPPPPQDGSQAPLAGYGYGLPLSRLYARYFHGDMFLVSMEGYGTDACVYLKAVSVEAHEVLPIYSASSKQQLTRGPLIGDWTDIFVLINNITNKSNYLINLYLIKFLGATTSSQLEKDLGSDQALANEHFYGLVNFGNTCYANSVIQALYFCKPFRERILAYRQTHKKSGIQKENLLTCLADLFSNISSQKRRVGTIAPKRFVLVEEKKREYTNGTLKTANGLTKRSNLITTNTHDYSARSTDGMKQDLTWIHEIFQGTLTNETRCLNCETVSSKDEDFLDLSVDIEQDVSISNCLRNFSNMETLCGDQKYLCETCGSKQEAQKRMRIGKLPKLLALHLKRFKYVETLNRHTKLSYRVLFPMELRLPNVKSTNCDSDKIFDLVAVVVHCGSTPNRGHYITLVKSHYYWLLFDDDIVDKLDESSIEDFFGLAESNVQKNSESAYILFYQQRNET